MQSLDHLLVGRERREQMRRERYEGRLRRQGEWYDMWLKHLTVDPKVPGSKSFQLQGECFPYPLPLVEQSKFKRAWRLGGSKSIVKTSKNQPG